MGEIFRQINSLAELDFLCHHFHIWKQCIPNSTMCKHACFGVQRFISSRKMRDHAHLGHATFSLIFSFAVDDVIKMR